ncbi:hypothetical protein ACJMK2_000703 [Sinanodonta woodiana]|uniref:DZIP3-like HEPN domain-containing protein n=1 Tax=Sinanodonta woodiana TaxID=1069815 RepID=A0ABD3XSD5_SINWO
MSVPQRFNESEYINWLKCTNAFIILKEGLHPFIDTGVKKLHTNVKQKVISFLSESIGTIQCKHCSSNDIFYKGATGRSSAQWIIKCPSSVCDVWLDEILTFHTEPDKRSINWTNSDISKWDTDPYEIAKVFMPKGLDRKTKLPEELDIPAILSLLKYCKYFMKYVPNTRLLTDLIDVRNILYHSGSFKVTDAQKDKWIDMMSQLVMDLNLPVTVRNGMYMLKKEEISIKFEDMETRALMNMVTLLQCDIEEVKNKTVSIQEIQSQLSVQTHTNIDDISDTRMKTNTLETDMKEVKTILTELSKKSDKIADFLEHNDIKGKDLLGVVGSNKKNIIELRSRQYEVEKNILDIKSDLSSVKEQVGKHKEETTNKLEQLEVTVEENEQEGKTYIIVCVYYDK